jgi:hypothetical protein
MQDKKSSSAGSEDSSPESEETKQCAICDSEKQLQVDTQNEDIYYCTSCLEKARRQQRAIDEGYEVEPEVEM